MMQQKIKLKFEEKLPWRLNYLESGMPYADRRMDRITGGGGRDSKTTIAGPRMVMSVKFEAGELQLLTPTPRSQLSGIEQSYVESDWGVFISGEGDQMVLDVVINNDSMHDYVVITHCCVLNKNVISCTRIPKVMKHHVSYGLDTVIPKHVRERLSPGSIFKEGERVCHTLATMESGDLGNGRESNCVFISSFSTNEDTCAVLDTTLDKFKTTSYEEFSIPVNNDHIPMNVHGTDEHYLGIPKVGDILEDGIVMALRSRRPGYHLARSNHASLSKPRTPCDIISYSKRGAEVISVEVIRATTSKSDNKYLPEVVVKHLDSEAAKTQRHHHNILALDKQYKREFGKAYTSDPSWHIAVVEATGALYGPKLKAYYPNGYGRRKEVCGTMDDNIITGYLIRIKVRSVNTPHLGYKFNDPNGAKYTISEIRNKDRMFTDRWGRTSEFITNGVANINRAIWGRLHDQYMSDARFHLLRNMREIYEMEGYDAAAEYYMGGVKVMSDKTYWKLNQISDELLKTHIQYILDKADFIQMDDELGDESLTITGATKVRNSKYAPQRGKLAFKDYRGRDRMTASPIRIGTLYVSANEKVGSDYNACNIPMLQHSGISRKLNSSDKKTSQLSYQANRVISEADFRMIYDSQPEEDAKLILRDGTSFDVLTRTIGSVLDGNPVPDLEISTSDSRGLEILKSEMLCDGVKLTNRPRKDIWKSSIKPTASDSDSGIPDLPLADAPVKAGPIDHRKPGDVRIGVRSANGGSNTGGGISSLIDKINDDV